MMTSRRHQALPRGAISHLPIKANDRARQQTLSPIIARLVDFIEYQVNPYLLARTAHANKPLRSLSERHQCLRTPPYRRLLRDYFAGANLSNIPSQSAMPIRQRENNFAIAARLRYRLNDKRRRAPQWQLSLRYAKLVYAPCNRASIFNPSGFTRRASPEKSTVSRRRPS